MPLTKKRKDFQDGSAVEWMEGTTEVGYVYKEGELRGIKVIDQKGQWLRFERQYLRSVLKESYLPEGKFNYGCEAYSYWEQKEKEAHCATATATFNHGAYQQLDILREFRDQIINVWRGSILCEHYDRIKTPVAMLVDDEPAIRNIFLYLFIIPSIELLRLRKNNAKLRNALLNILVFLIFLVGLGRTTLLFLVCKIRFAR